MSRVSASGEHMQIQPTPPAPPRPGPRGRRESLLRKSAPWLINGLSISALLVATLTVRWTCDSRNKVSRAKSDLWNLKIQINSFRSDLGRYPTSLSELHFRPADAILWPDGGWMEVEIAEDPWGCPYVYEFTGREGRPFELYTLGSDRRPGGTGSATDLTCWNRSR